MKFKLFGATIPKLEWQKLKSKQKNVPDLYRSAVPGGWLMTSGGDHAALVFIPDADHEWDGNSFPVQDDNDDY